MQARPYVTQDETSRGEAEAIRLATLDSIARSYGAALTAFFGRRVSNACDTHDLVQDVYLRMSRLQDLSFIDSPTGYLFRTAASALKDKWRRDAVRERGSHISFDEYEHGANTLAADRIAEGKQDLANLHRKLLLLPQRTRDVFLLKVFEEMKTADIAQFMGVSQRAVEKHFVKAMAHLRRAEDGTVSAR